MANETFQRNVQVLYTADTSDAVTGSEQVADSINDVEETARGATKETNLLTKSFKSLAGGVAALASIQQINKFAQDSIGLFKEQNKANRLVEVSFGDAAASIHSFAGELQETAKVGDETTLMYAGLLKNMQLTQDQTEKVITASADLVAGSGGLISMDAAVRNLAKTYSGMAGELGESVPVLRELTKEQLQAGLGVELIARQYKGLAEAVGKSPVGEIKGLTNTIGDLQEEIGEDLIPAQIAWLKTQKAVISTVRDLSPVLKAVAGGVATFAGVIETVADNKIALGIGATAAAVYGLNTAVAAGTLSWTSFNATVAANPIGLATIAVGGLIAAINKLSGDFDKVIDKQVEFLDADVSQTQKVIDTLEELTKRGNDWKAQTSAGRKETRAMEKQLESLTGQVVKYDQATGEATLVNKKFFGAGSEVATTVAILETRIKAKNIQEGKAAKKAEDSKKAMEAQAEAIKMATEEEKRKADAAKQRAKAEEAANTLTAQLAEENYLMSKGVRERALAELAIDLKRKEEILLAGGKTAAEAEVLLEENKYQRLREIKAGFMEEDALIEEERLQKEAEAEELQKAKDEAAVQRERQKYGQIIDIAASAAASISSIMDAVTSKRERNLDRETKKQIDAIKKSTASEEEKAKKIEAIEKKAAAERHKIEMSEWRNNLLMSIANTALAATKALASAPPPASFILAGATALAGGISTGIIASNKPQRMNNGGVLAGGSTTSDSVPFMGNAGERVIDKGRTRKLNKIIDEGEGMSQQTVNVSLNMPINIPEGATPETAAIIQEEVGPGLVGQVVRALEVAFEQGKIDTTRFNFAGAF